MSDVIDVMVNGSMVCSNPDPRAQMEMALSAAEQAGWRLVPMEPTEAMRQAWSELPHMECSFAEADWCQMIHAAPRPWDEVKR